MIRRAWARLVRKQWLIIYPVALAIINTLAFFAVYAASKGPLGWTAFFAANDDRGQFLYDQFLSHFHVSSALGVAIFAGIASCVFAALTRAPLFHAIGGPNYPRAPRKWSEAANLSLFYLLFYLVLMVGPLSLLHAGAWGSIAYLGALVVSVLVLFADYVIVFEDVGVLPALQRSVQLLRRRWLGVVGIFAVMYVVDYGLLLLYRHFYKAQTVFVILPVAQILLDSIVGLFFDLVLIYLYEDIRRQSPAG